MGSSLRRNMLLVEAIVNQEALQQGGTELYVWPSSPDWIRAKPRER